MSKYALKVLNKINYVSVVYRCPLSIFSSKVHNSFYSCQKQSQIRTIKLKIIIKCVAYATAIIYIYY